MLYFSSCHISPGYTAGRNVYRNATLVLVKFRAIMGLFGRVESFKPVSFASCIEKRLFSCDNHVICRAWPYPQKRLSSSIHTHTHTHTVKIPLFVFLHNFLVFFSSDSPLPVTSRVCFVKFRETESVGVSQHLTNTVFVDRALIVVPFAEGG